jgi:hypothetical protein
LWPAGHNSGILTGMAEPHVVTGLIAKRAELAGLLEHHQAMVRQLVIELDSLDQTLRLFAPDIELAEIKPKPLPPRHAAYKGEVARIILGTLRDAQRPCSTQELTMHVMAARGMNTADKRLVKTVAKRIGACLRHHRSKGVVTSDIGLGQRMVWEIKG